MDPNKLLAKVAELYAAMTSYEDNGVVLLTFGRRAASNPHRIEFSTAFSRPDLFRFEFSNPHPYPPLAHIITRHIHGFDGSKAYSSIKEYDQPARVQAEENLLMAVAGATGISGGSARTIAALLMPAIAGPLFANWQIGPALADRDLEGSRCHVVGAKPPRGGDVEVWIDHTTLAVRKLARSGEFPSQEIRRDIRINTPIPAALFVVPQG